jgi:hypothetical protein
MAEPFLHHFCRQLQSAFAGNSDRTLGLPVQLAFVVQLALAAGWLPSERWQSASWSAAGRSIAAPRVWKRVDSSAPLVPAAFRMTTREADAAVVEAGICSGSSALH